MATMIRNSLYMGLMLSFAGAASAAPEGSPTAGRWQEHKLAFAFMGFTSTYSCDGLADKLRSLLIAAGARPDAKVRAGVCSMGPGQPDRFARADLTFWTLTPEDAADSSAPSGGSGSKGVPVNGTWKPVSISLQSPRGLERGDCELVEQFAQKVLPLFTTRNVVNHTQCIPHQDSGSLVDLRFESLTAPKRPATGG
ncbi:MAG: hypothetical protein U1F35_17465 [Steroidobacteraceae bacterium]